MRRNPYDVSLSSLLEFDRSRPVNLVLSGGGEKGVAHIALLEKLEALGIQINSISCCSVGSLVGSMYASGKRPQEILSFFKETPLFKFSWLNPRKFGMFDSHKYLEYLEDFIAPSFDQLEIPIYITATNLEKGEARYFNEGELLTPLLASCAVPAIFSPIEIEGELYSDGGVMDNFPVFPFEHSKLPIIGSFLGSPTTVDKKDLNSIFKVTQRATSLMTYAIEQRKFFRTQLTVEFPLADLPGFDPKFVDEIYEKANEYLNHHGLGDVG